MKISIIMPMYNSEKYVEQTIHSIINQTYQNWELIVIDDCSNDNSVHIVQQFAKKDKRIKIYVNEYNLGICGNRNKGLKYATGDYIAFCDDDDLFSSNLLKDNIDIITNYPNVDMIKFGRCLINVDSNEKEFSKISTKMIVHGLIKNVDKYQKYFLIRKSDVFLNIWNGIYKKDIIEKYSIRFDENMKFGSEDADFSYKLFLNSEDIYLNPNIYYFHYKRNLTSTSRKFSKNKIDSILKTAETEFIIWEKIDFNNIENMYYRIISLNISIDSIMLGQMFHVNSNLKYNDRKKIYNIIKHRILKNNYIVNKKIKIMLWKNNKKHYFITKINQLKFYFLIDFFYKISSKFKNKKWK